MGPELAGDLESLVNRPLRNIGGCIGFSLDVDALHALDIVNDDGELVDDETSVKILIFDDEDGARVEAKIEK
jgi:hypothetical protein